jgi:hypothetical protein
MSDPMKNLEVDWMPTGPFQCPDGYRVVVGGVHPTGAPMVIVVPKEKDGNRCVN